MRLRRLERADLDYVLEWAEDPVFREFVFGDSRRSWRQHGAQAIALLGGALNSQNAGIGFFMLTDDKDQPVGLAAIYEMQWRNRQCASSLYVIPAHRTEDIVFDGWLGLLRYCFDELNLHRVSTRVAASDTTALSALARMGAKREVTYRGHLLQNGKAADLLGFGMLRPEYDRLAAPAAAEA
ncbi:MAG: hypothetical protein AMXMBFR84_38320 [Candidatus Hydrogenedentota bacterium]